MQDISLNPCNLWLYYGMEKRPKNTDLTSSGVSLRANYNPIKGVSNTMKLTQKQARVIISNQVGEDRALSMSPDEVNDYTESELGMSTATPRVNKMGLAPKEIQDAFAIFEATLTPEAMVEWNENLRESGTTISEVTANCKA